MNLQQIFENHSPKPILMKKEAAVLLLLTSESSDREIIFERRSSRVMQGGDSSFIGGHVDTGETPLEAIIREACEEASLAKEDFQILGELDYILTFSGMMIHVFLGELKEKKLSDLTPNDEVDFFFGIPLKFFLHEKPKVYHEQVKLVRAKNFPYDSVPGGKKYPFWRGDYDTYFYYYEDKVVWGMTAAVVRQFIKQIKEKSEDFEPI